MRRRAFRTGYIWPDSERLPIELLKQVNDHIRGAVRKLPNAVLADIHMHFLGHGVHLYLFTMATSIFLCVLSAQSADRARRRRADRQQYCGL
jgi:hypothetical protein